MSDLLNPKRKNRANRVVCGKLVPITQIPETEECDELVPQAESYYNGGNTVRMVKRSRLEALRCVGDALI